MVAHELPHVGQEELRIGVDEVQARHVDEVEVHGTTERYRVVTVLDLWIAERHAKENDKGACTHSASNSHAAPSCIDLSVAH